MSVIIKRIPVDELLVGLAEECSELSQAALKLHRVFDGRNPTPVPEDVAIEKLHEEIADVLLYLKQLDLPMKYIEGIADLKLKRWEDRLDGN
jgi:NTP pyrophosphatase (non-canonical NTP hydrolase)